jgi:nitric oxide reductase NorQ protein
MTAPAIPAPAPKGRLGNGQLRRQVAEWLAARPGPHTVDEIAKGLGRSAGAVGNALTTLADRAEAARLAGKPVRYEANSARRRSRRHHPQGLRPAQGRPCRAAGRAEAGRLVSAEGSRPEGRARPGHPPRRAGLPAARTGRDGRASRRCARSAPKASPPCLPGRPAPARRAWSRRPSPT